MSTCLKYGPGRVNVMPETTTGQAVAIDSDYNLQAQACTFGAMYRETLDNTAVRMNRGANKPFEGAQSELTWSIDYVVPRDVAAASLGYQTLLAGIGRKSDGSMEPEAICNHTLQIARCDRDAMLLEVMNGCLVSQAEYAFSTADLPKVTFSGVARSKLELHGQVLDTPVSVTAGQEDIDMSSTALIARYSYWLMGSDADTHPAPTDGIKVIFQLTTGAKIQGSLTALDEYAFSAAFDTAFSADASIEAYQFVVPAPASDNEINIVAPEDWALEQVAFPDNVNLAVTACNITIESGLSYGNLAAGHLVPTTILSGQCNITGTFSLYLDETADELMRASEVNLQLHTVSGGLMMPHCKLNEKPAYDLSATDAASGDFSFTAYSATTTFDSLLLY